MVEYANNESGQLLHSSVVFNSTLEEGLNQKKPEIPATFVFW